MKIEKAMRKTLNDFQKRITRNATESAVEAAKIMGEQIVNDARQELEASGHVNTGRLRDSIHYEVEDYGEMGAVLRIVADATDENGQPYGPHIEALDPFIATAARDNLSEFDVDIVSIFKDKMHNGG